MAKKTQELSFSEKMGLLAEAIELFDDVEGELSRAAFAKARALSTVEECVRLYQKKMLDGGEPNEKELKDCLLLVINEDLVNKFSEQITDDLEKLFYLGGFGLALGIMNGQKSAINGLKKLIEMKENLPKKEKTLQDLLY